MKIIIISDIQGKAKSIIPYGLRMGRSLETEVDIIHIIDPRKIQGTSSPYADSQSITPDEKLSHEKIIQREMNRASFALQKFISAEGSRLNYPLKINLVVESGRLKNSISAMMDSHPGSMIMASYIPDNSMVDDLDELFSITKELDIPFLFIPPEYPFKEVRNCMLFNDFIHNSYKQLSQVIEWLKPFDPKIHAFCITENKDRTKAVKVSTAWKRKALSCLESPVNLKTTMIGNDDDQYHLHVDFIKRNKAELILIPRYMMGKRGASQLSLKQVKKAMKEIALPAAIY